MRLSLAAELIAAQRAVNRALFDAALGNLLEADITMAQLKALAVIGRQPNCTIGVLSEQLGIKPPAASLLVDKLVRAGLASRRGDPLDGRRVIVHATAHGTALVNRIRHGAQSLLEHWVGQLGGDDLAALHRGSRALAAVANQSGRGARESTPPVVAVRRAAVARP